MLGLDLSNWSLLYDYVEFIWVFQKQFNLLYRSNGNPFNTTVVPSPAPTQALPSLVAPVPSFSSDAPTGHKTPTRHSGPTSTVRKNSTMSFIAYAAIVVIVIIAVLLVLFCALKLRERHLKCECLPKNHKKMAHKRPKEHLSTTDLTASNYNKEDCKFIHLFRCPYPMHFNVFYLFSLCYF